MIPLSDPDVQRHSQPYVTMGIIAINAVVFLYELTLGDFGQTRFYYEWGLIPAKLTQGLSEFGQYCDGQIVRTAFGNLVCQGTIVNMEAPNPAWVTVFTAMFIHGGLMHFAGNMLYLWVFGDNIEDRLGHGKYLAFYLTCGVAATWAQVAINTDSPVPTIGASGAIAGVLGAYLLLFPYNRINTLVIMYFIMVIRVPALFLLGFWFFLQNFFQGLWSLGSTGGGVAYWAHIGGFASGILVIALYLKVTGQPVWPNARRFPWRWSR
ncbi:MAG: rhomboid family intramembrane serine protease [Chloroflexi bacterium]|nr:rhomboid family intramembrane serine protease [Chloroflexota bacterium]